MILNSKGTSNDEQQNSKIGNVTEVFKGEVDPILLMKRLFSENKMNEVIETENEIVIGDRSWSKDTRTNFGIGQAGYSSSGSSSNSYTLLALFQIMRSNSLIQYHDRAAIFRFMQERVRPSHVKIDNLPDEMITKILTYIPNHELAKNVSLVSKRLRNASHTPSLWKELKITQQYYHTSSINEAERLILRCTLLRTLNIWGQLKDSVKIATMALRSRQQLLELKLTVDYNVEGLSKFFTAVKESVSLRRLHITALWHSVQLRDNAECLANLTNIRLYMLEDNGLLRAIGISCKKLEHFEYNCLDNGVDLSFFLRCVRSTIKSVTKSDTSARMSDEGVRNIDQCNLLETLVMPSLHIGRLGLESIFRLHSLRTLDLSGCLFIDDANLVNALDTKTGMRNLRDLNLTSWDGLGDSGLIAIVDKCPHLKVLNLNDCRGLTDVGVRHVLRKCVELTELSLRYIPKVVVAFEVVVNAPLEVLAMNKSRSSYMNMAMIREKLPHLRKLKLQV